MSAAINQLVTRWTTPGGLPFTGRLISSDGCMCAQGQALHYVGGYSADDLRAITQEKADKETARLLGISTTHAVLLRNVNDSVAGAPSIVLTHPEKILGDQAQTVLAFWRHLDKMTPEAGDAAWDAAWGAAGATNEIQGAAIMRAKGQPFFFLPLFGFANPEAILEGGAA